MVYVSFRFTAKLNGRYRGFPYTPHTHSFHHYQHSPSDGTSVTADEPILTHHDHPGSIVCSRVHSWWCTFYGFGQVYPSMEYHRVFSLP